MKPLVNLDEKIGKTVGRRVLRNSGRYGAGLQRLANEVIKTVKRPLCPKGVFRFHSHEEADAWMLKMMTRRVNQS